VQDIAVKAREAGLRNILVTNGYIQPAPMRELLPFIDAMNIDLKAFDDAVYRHWCGGRLQPVIDTIAICRASCHVEVTTLVVPGMNYSLIALVPLFDWLAALDRSIPLHLSRYFPANLYTAPPTDRELMFRLAQAAKERLEHVYVGNV
jgi:pyruvate formate lyase activating enzyme